MLGTDTDTQRSRALDEFKIIQTTLWNGMNEERRVLLPQIQQPTLLKRTIAYWGGKVYWGATIVDEPAVTSPRRHGFELAQTKQGLTHLIQDLS